MNGKYLVVFIVSAAFFLMAATNRFHDSAHAIGTIKKGGGSARHPAYLDKDRESYILIATAAVIPPYSGNARVVLEGDPSLTATFHNSGPAIDMDLGLHRHPEFRDNTYFDLRPRDRVALWVKIKREQPPLTAPAPPSAGTGTARVTPAAECAQCEPEPAPRSPSIQHRQVRPPASAMTADHAVAASPSRQDKAGDGRLSKATEHRGGYQTGAASWTDQQKGPAVAFYDTATNEPLLKIPIRFIGGTGGGNGH